MLLGCAAFGTDVHATTYDVGPGKPYTSIGAVPWESLAAGDNVRIYWRSTPYQEKWVLCRQGTASAPITVSGVPNTDGSLPIIDGNNATTRSSLNYWGEARGVIKIGGATRPADTMPRYITIENLDIRNSLPAYTFKGYAGTTQSYAATGAALYIEKGENITIRNCVLRDSSQGLSVSSNEGQTSKDILVEKCYIVNNGLENDVYRHNVYTEAAGITFQYNRFGPLRANCSGNNLKDRSAGLVVRYNWIEGGNRELDLVDAEDSALLRNDPRYHQTFVYGNVFVEPVGDGSRQIVHYGGDSGALDNYRKGTLYFYNNTVVSRRSDYTTLFSLSTRDESCDFRNNIVQLTATGNWLSLLEGSSGVITSSHNWFKTGCVSCFQNSDAHVINDGTSIGGTNPGFVNEAADDFRLSSTSPAINAGTNVASTASISNNISFQYVKHRASEMRVPAGPMDIGAFESPYVYVLPAFTTPPQGKTIVEGQTGTLSATVTGTQPLRYQWFFNNAPLANATNNVLPIYPALTNQSGNYQLVVTNNAGAVTSAVAVLTVNSDTNVPVVKASFPTSNGTYTNQVTNSVLTARGTATDNGRVNHVLYSVNNGNWQEAGINTNATNVNWTADLPTAPGTNVVTFKSVDFHGRESVPLVLKYVYNVPSIFAVNTTGNGTLKATSSTLGTPTNGAALFIARGYTITATPAPGMILSNWTDQFGHEFQTNATTLNFLMRSNLSLTANFIQNPLLRFGGVYNGLFVPNDGATRDRAGFVNLTISTNATYSGKMMVDGDNALTFSGKVRPDGSSETTIPRTKQHKSTLTLSFAMDLAGGSDTLTGTVSDGMNWSSPLLADRNVWTTNQPATALTNSFTMLLPGMTNSAGPSGSGFGAGTINAAGSLTFSGFTADNRAISHTIPVSKNGQWPLYIPFNSIPRAVTNSTVVSTNLEFQEFLIGWVNFSNRQPAGVLTWLKSPVPGDLFSSGFTNEFDLLGSVYQPPATGVRAIAMTNGIISFTGGDLSQPVSRTFTLATNNSFVFAPGNNPPKITLTTRTGTFTGTFVDPAKTNVLIKFSGVLSPDQKVGGGYFYGTNFVGSVEMNSQ